MSGQSRVDEVVDFLLDGIEQGRFPIDGRLPSEEALAELSGASRLTVREATKVLAAQRVLRSVQGRGTFVAPVNEWLGIEALVRVRQGNPAEVLAQLFEVRAMIEIGAAERFAGLVTDAELDKLELHLAELSRAHAEGDAVAAAEADWAFHEVIIEGCDNPFLAATMQPLTRALREARRETSKLPVMREHAVAAHAKVIEALRARDRAAARQAMRAHMRETRSDSERFFQPT